MNTKDDKYSELINQIKTLDVKLSNPQKLASRIISDIELLPKKKNNDKILRIISLMSSIAASLLIGLFVFEQYFLPLNMEDKSLNATSFPYKSVYFEKSNPLNDFEKWIQIKECQQKRQNLYLNIINKHKISQI